MSGAFVPQTDPAAPLRARLATAPRLSDAAAAEAKLAMLAESPALAPALAASAVKNLLAGIADHSPYLWHLIRSDPARLLRLLDAAPEASLAACLERLAAGGDAAGAEADVMRHLRLAKQEIALLIALADLGGVWGVETVMAGLTKAADAFVRVALRFVLRRAASSRHLACDDPQAPDGDCGLVILALGKHGAGELNYSSDTDLIVLFDPGCPAAQHGEPAALFVRLTRQLVKLLQERTAEGYVLRVDLRLRPDPASTAIAIAVPAAYSYYELYGQNWERAAMIKARPIAGDLRLGGDFLARLRPFIWRKYLDYAAIADIHAMKRQIHAVRGHADVTVAGHDVKLGRGGIREIEFFVQTQQLVFGGRRPELRGSKTLDMLAELAREGLVTAEAKADLRTAYLFLREIEHRLQMLADEQTQRLPKDDAQLEAFARFCGFADLAAFSIVFIAHLEKVAEHYARLFERAPDLSAEIGNLVFTGVTDDPETLETLARLGFKRPALVAETVRGWHFGRRAGVRSERAREVLTEVVPALLEAFARSGDPDAALAGFDSALGRMKAAAELLAILKSNAHLRDLFANILGSAPRLAEMVVRRPHVLDAAIDANRLAAELDVPAIAARLSAQVAEAASTEDFLDLLRDFVQEESFLIGLRLLADLIAPEAAGQAYAALAESVVSSVLSHVQGLFAEKYGRLIGSRCVILGLGKLGSREMTAGSDLDLILIYDFDAAHPLAEGPGQLDAVRYFTALTQRLISALTVLTRRGKLYEVDMRLRPSGRKGPVATQFSSFALYQREEAQNWEHMALTRARVIAGDLGLACDVEAARAAILSQKPSPGLRLDIAEMRALIAQEKQPRGPFDLKYATGGLIDIDFIAQYLSLAHAYEDKTMLANHPSVLLERAAISGFLDAARAETLLAARRLYTDITQILQTFVEADAFSAPLNVAVGHRLAAVAGLPDVARLEAQVRETRAAVAEILQEIIF